MFPAALGGYVGPLDLVPGAIFAGALRRLRAAYSGPLCRIRENGANAERDFYPDGDGWIDRAAVAGFLGANSGFVVTLYDQSGGGNHFTQATSTKQPRYVANISGLGGRPGVLFNGSNDILVASNFSTAQAGMVIAAFRTGAITTGDHILLSSADEATAGIRLNVVYAATNNRLRINQQNNDTTDSVAGPTTQIAASTSYIAAYKSDGSAYTIRRNGANQTLSVLNGANNGDWFGDVTGADNYSLGGGKWNAEAQWLLGHVTELIVYGADMSVTYQGLLEAALNSVYRVY